MVVVICAPQGVLEESSAFDCESGIIGALVPLTLYGTAVPFVNLGSCGAWGHWDDWDDRGDWGSVVIDGPCGLVGENPHQRADARRNRLQILEAAEVCFAEQGVGVPIDDIARKAGVGVGTVYRHFPTKEALVEAIIVTRMQELAAQARALATSDDPGEAFFTFLGVLADVGSEKRDLIDALAGAEIEIRDKTSAEKDELTAAIAALLTRAQQAGEVRTDVELPDLFGLVMGACSSSSHLEVGCSQTRMLSIVCDGLRAH
jgi:AcrR family transcriptional regulator